MGSSSGRDGLSAGARFYFCTIPNRNLPFGCMGMETGGAKGAKLPVLGSSLWVEEGSLYNVKNPSFKRCQAASCHSFTAVSPPCLQPGPTGARGRRIRVSHTPRRSQRSLTPYLCRSGLESDPAVATPAPRGCPSRAEPPVNTTRRQVSTKPSSSAGTDESEEFQVKRETIFLCVDWARRFR